MKIFQTYTEEREKNVINQSLFWDYSMEDFDWQKYRRVVVDLSLRDLDFMCHALKEDTKCYRRTQLRKEHLSC